MIVFLLLALSFLTSWYLTILQLYHSERLNLMQISSPS